ncbi:hypothetical protein VP01_7099g1 [Puccinia sorghi]|uniref:Uncharacterized protein n=1 Tax=Puccinia sorghi TaxID=27349 RepID=A0A0L6UEF8_9BASI|nr:hypothetical protein VP01_7099g1 [Puccinia sorghi]
MGGMAIKRHLTWRILWMSRKPRGEAIQKQVETLSKAVESLASKVDNQAKGKYSHGNNCPSGKIYDPRPCHYCHREGHSIGYFQESQKDETKVNTVYQRNNPSVFEIKEDAKNQQNLPSSVHKIEWETRRLGSTNFDKLRMEANCNGQG